MFVTWKALKRHWLNPYNPLQPLFPEFIDILIPGNSNQKTTQNKGGAGVATGKGDFELVEEEDRLWGWNDLAAK